MKYVILITGTPAVGKTTTAKALTAKLNAQYINLTDFAKAFNLVLGEDKERQTTIIDEEAMSAKLAQTIGASSKDTVIIDGHYAAAVTPPELVTHVFVLRRNPVELKEQMSNCGFSPSKTNENLLAEILDSSLIEAMDYQPSKVCEIDTTSKTTHVIITEIVDVLENRVSCQTGFIDWLSVLEQQGLTDQYLKT